MIEIGSRMRGQPPPPHVVFEALVEPDRDPSRPWLDLLDDEQPPQVLRADPPSTVVWSSLWIKRPTPSFNSTYNRTGTVVAICAGRFSWPSRGLPTR